MPVKLIDGIATLRTKEVAKREKARAAAPKKRESYFDLGTLMRQIGA